MHLNYLLYSFQQPFTIDAIVVLHILAEEDVF